MRRRDFATLGPTALVVMAAGLPLAARAQQPSRMRRIGILVGLAANDPEEQARIATFLEALQGLGWIDGRSLRIDIRWGGGNADDIRRYAAELVGLAPDAILASTTPTVAALQQATRTMPIVFVAVADPVGSGFVASMARPGANTTGFSPFDSDMSGKWLELLKEIAPGVGRGAVLRDPGTPTGISLFGAIQAAAPSLGLEISPIDVRDPGEIEHAVTEFARSSNGGLIVLPTPSAVVHRPLILTLAARHRLPAVYPVRLFVSDGGLVCYGPDIFDQYRRAAGYVDRIFKGEKPADLPVQAPVKYELVINLKTANALGIEVPASILARADEVIE